MDAVNLAVNSAKFPFLLFSWCSLYFSIKQWHTSSQERERLLRAEAEVREARLQALRYQLNPHFLFNSLNAVSTLVLDGEASAATKMLSQIGDFLRTSLNDQAALEAPLSQEMAFTEQYIAIEKTRLGDAVASELRRYLQIRSMPWCRECYFSRWSRMRCAMAWRTSPRAGKSP